MEQKYEQRARKFYEIHLNGSTVDEIADMYFMSSMRVRQIIDGYKRDQGIDQEEEPKKHLSKDRAEKRAIEFRELRLKGVTLEDIASTYGLTRQRIDQIIKRYEKRYNLPSSTETGRELAVRARHTDIKEQKQEQRHERQLQSNRFVPCFQLDAHLIGRFLIDLGKNALQYGYDGKSKSNPKKAKDGSPYPSMSKPTNIFMNKKGKHVTVHAWVLLQNGIVIQKGYQCHHIDGDITNNMLENLQVLTNVEHGRITMQEYRKRVPRTLQIPLDFGIQTP